MLNKSRIEELKAEVGHDDFIEVVVIFCEEVEETLDALREAALSSLPEKLHFLKGSALNIGLDAVGALCRQEEQRLIADPNAIPDIASIRALYMASKAELLS